MARRSLTGAVLVTGAAVCLAGCSPRILEDVSHSFDGVSHGIESGRSFNLHGVGHDFGTIGRDTSGLNDIFSGARTRASKILTDTVGNLADEDAAKVVQATCDALDLLSEGRAPNLEAALNDVAADLTDGLYFDAKALGERLQNARESGDESEVLAEIVVCDGTKVLSE
jgi:hypothetical protein